MSLLSYRKTIKWLIISFIFSISSILSAKNPQLNLHISHIQNNNHWFLCLPHENGCMSLRAAARGKLFPISSQNIQHAFLLDTQHLTLHAQTLPDQCKNILKPNQTLHIEGRLQLNKQNALIQDIHCHLTG